MRGAALSLQGDCRSGAREVAHEVIQGGLCSESQVYRVAQRFVEQGPAGMADRREDNGDPKITEAFEWELLVAVACSPRDYGYLRTTWTQELRAGIGRADGHHGQCDDDLSTAQATSSAIGSAEADRRLSLAKGPSNTAFATDSATTPQSAPRRDGSLCRRSRHSLESQDRTGLDVMRTTKMVLTPGKNEKRYLAGALDARTGRLTWVEGDARRATCSSSYFGNC